MKINIVGGLNEGYRREVFGINNSVPCFLTDEGKSKIQYARRDIDKFLESEKNISDYLNIIGEGEKSKYELGEAIFDAIDTKKNNKFIKFLYKNSDKIRDIAITTRHTGALIVMEISIYIRDYLLNAGKMSVKDRKFMAYQG